MHSFKVMRLIRPEELEVRLSKKHSELSEKRDRHYADFKDRIFFYWLTLKYFVKSIPGFFRRCDGGE